MVDSEKKRWAKIHALRLTNRFEQWQKPLGIEDDDYLDYLTENLSVCCDDPLYKSFIESIS